MNHVINIFLDSQSRCVPTLQARVFSRKFLLTRTLPRSSRINVPLLNHAPGMMWLCVSMSAMAELAYGSVIYISIAFQVHRPATIVVWDQLLLQRGS